MRKKANWPIIVYVTIISFLNSRITFASCLRSLDDSSSNLQHFTNDLVLFWAFSVLSSIPLEIMLMLNIRNSFRVYIWILLLTSWCFDGSLGVLCLCSISCNVSGLNCDVPFVSWFYANFLRCNADVSRNFMIKFINSNLILIFCCF